MLRSYSEREKSKERADAKTETKVMPESEVVASVVFKDGTEAEGDNSKELIECCPVVAQETWRDVKVCESLTEEQKKQVEDVLAQNADVLSDLPGCIHLEMHHVNTTTE